MLKRKIILGEGNFYIAGLIYCFVIYSVEEGTGNIFLYGVRNYIATRNACLHQFDSQKEIFNSVLLLSNNSCKTTDTIATQ